MIWGSLCPGVENAVPTLHVHPRRLDMLQYPLQLPQDALRHSLIPPRSPYISSRPHASTLTAPADAIEVVLAPGDTVGEGCSLQGEPIRLLSISSHRVSHDPQPSDPAPQLEVIRRLGSGSYAVVYLVKEVLSRPVPSEDGHIDVGPFDLDGHPSCPPQTVYGRKYAIKCLSKANLDTEALDAQLTEVRLLPLPPSPSPASAHTFPRLPFISHSIHTLTLSPSTGPLRPPRSSSSS